MPELIPLQDALKIMGVPRPTYYWNVKNGNESAYPKAIRRSPRRIVMDKQEVLEWLKTGVKCDAK